LRQSMKTLTIILTDGPYISEYAQIAYRIAFAALDRYKVNIFLYLDAVNIGRADQRPEVVKNEGLLFQELAERGALIRACSRCSAARGYQADEDGRAPELLPGILISSLYDLACMIEESHRVVALGR